MAKIISLSPGRFEKKKQRALTAQMVTSLLKSCQKQKEGIPFGPNDIKGSFTALITRGLIVRKAGPADGQNQLTWHVTPEAIQMLKNMGIEVSC